MCVSLLAQRLPPLSRAAHCQLVELAWDVRPETAASRINVGIPVAVQHSGTFFGIGWRGCAGSRGVGSTADASLHFCAYAADYAGRSTTLFIFKAVPKHLSAVLKALSRIGIGVHHGSIDIVALESTKPLLSTFTGTGGKKKRKYKITDRRSVEEIYQIVDEQSHLTFDYLLNICVAGLIAGTIGMWPPDSRCRRLSLHLPRLLSQPLGC